MSKLNYLFIALVSFAVYSASLANPFFILDDGLLIFENNILREISFENLRIMFSSFDPELYIPLTIFSYQIDYLIGGYSPFIYHFTNLLLHTANACLVACAAELLLRDHLHGKSLRQISLAIGLIFAVHPINTEAIVWASSRKDLLSSFFLLLALTSYLKIGKSSVSKKITTYLYFLLALLAKVSVVILPLLLLLIDFYRGRKFTVKTWIEKIPYFVLSIIFGIVALLGKQSVESTVSLFERGLLACKSIIFYVIKIIFPINLSVFYPQLEPISLIGAEFLISVILIIISSYLLFRFRKKYQYVIFGMLFFVISLLPSFISVTKGGNILFASNRYAYIASIGVIYVVVKIIYEMFDRKTFQNICLICIAIFSYLSFTESVLWKNNADVFRKSTEIYPEFYHPYISLGASERLSGNPREAIEAYEKAIELHSLPNTHAVIGQVYAEQGKFSLAEAKIKEAISLGPKDPELRYALGQVYVLQKKFDLAEEEYMRALELYPDDENEYEKLARRISSRRDMVYLRLGVLYGIRGDHEKAIEFQKKAIEENEYLADAYYNLAIGLGKLGKKDEAIFNYEKVLEINPGYERARMNLEIMRD